MKYCPQCHLSYNDDANICTQCGNQLFVAASQVPVRPLTDHTAEFKKEDVSANKVLAMIPYLMGWIGIIVTLLAANTSPYAGFHVRQALKI